MDDEVAIEVRDLQKHFDRTAVLRHALFSKKWRRRALCRESAIHHRVLRRKPWPAAAASRQVLDSPCFHALALKLQ